MEEFELRNKTLKKSFDILMKPSFEMSVPNLTFFYLIKSKFFCIFPLLMIVK